MFANLPPPGPDHFAVRRALWVTPTAASRLDQNTSASRIHLLESLLKKSDALESFDVWDGLLPLPIVIMILHAGWRRDGTWPHNATVLDEDNFFGTRDSRAIAPNAAASLATSGGG